MNRLIRVSLNKAGHIEKPYSLDEILDKIESDDYSAEMMLQHLLLHLAEKKHDYSEHLLKIQEAARKLPELMSNTDFLSALDMLSQVTHSANEMIHYIYRHNGK